MKKRMKRSSAILLAAAIVLIAVGGIRGAQASLTYFSKDYNAWFYLNHLQVHLLENGRDVCDGKNDLDGENKIHGELVQYLGYAGGVPGEVEPGRTYQEKISAKNGQDIPIFLRITVKKYWVDRATGEKVDDMEKVTDLSPDRIRLTYGANQDGKNAYELYNTDAWVINPQETTAESATYYYRTSVASGAETSPLFDRLMIDPSMMALENVTEEKNEETGKTIYTYEYLYDGYVFVIEADVQAIQTHNIEDAIHSQWGVYNVTADYDMDAESGTLSVNAQ